MLADPSQRAFAVEERGERAARISRNAAAFGVPGLTVVNGCAPDALRGLPSPDAVFVGGGASEAVLDVAARALHPGGRLVVNAVTLETQSLVVARHAAIGGDLVRIAIEHAEPLGGFETWRPALPVIQWTWVKP
jgi:precorrin-6Y C5,15-methyltransferase (decarboxylating)